MTADGDSRRCPVCGCVYERKHYENPKRWAGRIACSRKCGGEAVGKPINVGIIRPGGLSIEEIAIVADLDRTNVKVIYDSAVAKFRKRMARYVGIRR